MKAVKATVEILLDPESIGPDAPYFSDPGHFADWFSAVLSDNPDILDWGYVNIEDTYEVIDIDPDSYEEGEMFVTPIIGKISV